MLDWLGIGECVAPIHACKFSEDHTQLRHTHSQCSLSHVIWTGMVRLWCPTDSSCSRYHHGDRDTAKASASQYQPVQDIRSLPATASAGQSLVTTRDALTVMAIYGAPESYDEQRVTVYRQASKCHTAKIVSLVRSVNAYGLRYTISEHLQPSC